MFFLNHMLGTVLVQPDWDAQFQIALKYLTLGLSVYLITEFADVIDAVSVFEDFYD